MKSDITVTATAPIERWCRYAVPFLGVGALVDAVGAKDDVEVMISVVNSAVVEPPMMTPSLPKAIDADPSVVAAPPAVRVTVVELASTIAPRIVLAVPDGAQAVSIAVAVIPDCTVNRARSPVYVTAATSDRAAVDGRAVGRCGAV